MNPLSEIFGFPIENDSTKAQRYRKQKLCPFNNKVPNCTKDKANNPLGICSIRHENISNFTEILQNKLEEHLDNNSPDAPSLTDLVSQ